MFFTTTKTDDVAFETIAEAKDAAFKITQEQAVEVQVLGHVDGQPEPILVGQTSPLVSEAGVKVVGHFPPWTRIEEIPTKWVAPFVSGYTLAYTRTRIATGVYRPNVKGEPWLVFNTQTGEKAYALNTAAARSHTNRMRQEAKQA